MYFESKDGNYTYTVMRMYYLINKLIIRCSLGIDIGDDSLGIRHELAIFEKLLTECESVEKMLKKTHFCVGLSIFIFFFIYYYRNSAL